MKEYMDYNGEKLEVRGGAWCDDMNSCFYTVIDKINGFNICQENEWDKDGNLKGKKFALHNYYN